MTLYKQLDHLAVAVVDGAAAAASLVVESKNF